MIIDNENGKEKLFEKIKEYQTEGNFHLVTGYFTLNALYQFFKCNEAIIHKYKMILGDYFINTEHRKDGIDLMNEELSIDSAMNLSLKAREVVSFLEQEKVHLKTLEPNFCHAKLFINISNKNEEKNSFYIFGSSNLTDAGIGLVKNHNIELNTLGQGSTAEYKDMKYWFDRLWNSEKAKDKIKNFDKKDINFKQYLINEIKKLFEHYTPEEIYYKILYMIWGDEYKLYEDPEFSRKLGRLQNTKIWSLLYSFQQKAVLSLIKMLREHNGAILADAVGLGKTWTALSVIKYFEYEGYQTIVICPKKLQHNWEQFFENEHKLYSDRYEYKIRFHSDLMNDRWDRYTGSQKYTIDDMTNDKPKLIIIDESHNLRNDKSGRYIWLTDNILKNCKGEVKVLLLSATPINNSFIDIRNQFKLLVRNYNDGFNKPPFFIKNLESTFRSIHTKFSMWRKEDNRTSQDFIHSITDTDFFKLTDNLTVARTRDMVMKVENSLMFPIKNKPITERVSPKEIGNYSNFEDLISRFPSKMAAYQPTFYLPDTGKKQVLEDEKQRDRFLVKMMYILLAKRFESSWESFRITIDKIFNYQQSALDKIKRYKEQKEINSKIEFELFDEEELDAIGDEEGLGKRDIKIADIDKAGKLESFRKHILDDIEQLQALKANLTQMQNAISEELKTKNNHKSKDKKLERLIHNIKIKREKGENNNNQKVLIFTVFTDTAQYLFEQLTCRGFDRVAMVSGSYSRTTYSKEKIKNFEPILEQFAPYTKLYIEKNWENFNPDKDLSLIKNFDIWKEWISKNKPEVFKKLNNPIDILIATDCLSEGQNLQDCDYVVNYDVHWNPVRVLQRNGRIDRLGSPNSKIFSVNFWPTDNINEYLNLQSRIEDRMIAMRLAGSELDKNFTEGLSKKIGEDQLDRMQEEKMLRQLEITWDDIETNDSSVGFDTFSLENLRQDLQTELLSNHEKYENMANGVYSGFIKINELLPKPGLIALIGSPARPANRKNYKYEKTDLIYLDENAELILSNQNEILAALQTHKKCPRANDYLYNIDIGDKEVVKKIAEPLKKWAKKQFSKLNTDVHGKTKEVAGDNQISLLDSIKKGNPDAIANIEKDEDYYSENNFDLITWILVGE